MANRNQISTQNLKRVFARAYVVQSTTCLHMINIDAERHYKITSVKNWGKRVTNKLREKTNNNKLLRIGSFAPTGFGRKGFGPMLSGSASKPASPTCSSCKA